MTLYQEYKLIKNEYLTKRFGFRVASKTMSRLENETVHGGKYVVNDWINGERVKYTFDGLAQAIYFMVAS